MVQRFKIKENWPWLFCAAVILLLASLELNAYGWVWTYLSWKGWVRLSLMVAATWLMSRHLNLWAKARSTDLDFFYSWRYDLIKILAQLTSITVMYWILVIQYGDVRLLSIFSGYPPQVLIPCQFLPLPSDLDVAARNFHRVSDDSGYNCESSFDEEDYVFPR